MHAPLVRACAARSLDEGGLGLKPFEKFVVYDHFRSLFDQLWVGALFCSANQTKTFSSVSWIP